MPILLAALLLFATVLPGALQAAPFAGRTALIMVDAIDCGYCRKWERDVGPAYSRSDEGRFAPLVKIRRGDQRLSEFRGLAYTPTFILVVDGTERGRIIGYPGPDFFWAELDRLIKRGPPAPDSRVQAGPLNRL